MVGIAMIVMAEPASRVSPTVSWVAILEGLAALVTIIGAVLYIWRQTKDQRQRNERFDRDWYGEPDRPGVPARPGVMEQLLTLSSNQQVVIADVGQIKTEVFPNHGGSIKDAVTRMDLRLETVELDVRGIHERLDKQPNVHP